MPDRPTLPVEVRADLIHALRLDLVGPTNDGPLATEELPEFPSRWYLTGFLVPSGASLEQRSDAEADDSLDEVNNSRAADDEEAPERTAAKRVFFPSSMGISFLIPRETATVEVRIRWGDYRPDLKPTADEPAAKTVVGASQIPLTSSHWRRTPREVVQSLTLPTSSDTQLTPVPDSGGLRLAYTVRPARADGLPEGARAVSVFLVNQREGLPDLIRDQAFVFQAELEVRSKLAFVARPNLQGLNSDDLDERTADLQFRDAFEYAVGHNISTLVDIDSDGDCRTVRTCWIPTADVERVATGEIAGVTLEMEQLAELADGAAAQHCLGELVQQYDGWLKLQTGVLGELLPRRREIAEDLLRRADIAKRRIAEGIALLAQPDVLEAFRLANRTMATAARQRFGPMQGKKKEDVSPPKWRPFQLAFILMNLRGIAEPTHAEREVVDLLFFPTGGGKTEAYLGLAAFTLVLRRLRNPGLTSAGLCVLMRYTLRLLTLDQLGRAATLICALELERQENIEKLGSWPFEIGLWVGKAATPNVMGQKGDNRDDTARAKTLAYRRKPEYEPSPIPLEECPWCGTKFDRDSFQLYPNEDFPTDLRVLCSNRSCEFIRGRPLPILAVDEPIYRRLPCFLIATVDKFANMPWVGEVGGFFGRVSRADKDGFYGPCDPTRGSPLPGPLLPPDLIIQDELHLISGPMGTMVGLYETALDELSTRRENGHVIRPKIVASTATVRRAQNQIRALFNRCEVDVFPPPGPNRRDSFFAVTKSSQESHARVYVGIAAQGRSPKVALLRTYLALLGAAQKSYVEAGGDRNPNNPADPYMTLLGYFNSLRELGGTRRIVEDEVGSRLTGYGLRMRAGEKQGAFAKRHIAYEVVELTSRVSTNKVADAKRRLAVTFCDSDKKTVKDRVDVALATNMISVGLDITRLGLMVVFSQPKASAEYIQATSRVGRDLAKPGLVVTLLNVHRPRDRSHYERFGAYHQSFYRTVEATSVTPFSPPALERGLAGTLVALVRHGHPSMTPPRGAGEIGQYLSQLDYVWESLARRASGHNRDVDPALGEHVRRLAKRLIDDWAAIAHDYQQHHTNLQYQREQGEAKPLLYNFLDSELKKLPPVHKKFRANRSMRDVEPSVNLKLMTLSNQEVRSEDDDQ